MAHDVFVSYPSSDKATADAVVNALESRGTRCWFAPRDVSPGADWASAIVEAIRNARLMVLVFSDATNASEHILREVRQAADADVPIVPFRTTSALPNSSLDYYIGGTHWLDALTPPIESHLSQLVETAERLLARAGSSSDATPHLAEEPPAPASDAARSARSRPLDRRVAFAGAGVVALAIIVVIGVAALSGEDESASASSSSPNLPASPQPSGETELAWVERVESGHWYALTETGRSWEELAELARTFGARLVAIDDADEEEWLFSQFGQTEFWIGLTDRAVEGEWTWTSGEPAAYLNWCPGEPTDTAGGAGAEDAAYAIPWQRCWFDEGVWWTEFTNPDGSTTPSYPGVFELDRPPG